MQPNETEVLQDLLNTLKTGVYDQKIDCCPWGSCQYKPAYTAYEAFLKCFNALGKNRVLQIFEQTEMPTVESCLKLINDDYKENVIDEDPEEADDSDWPFSTIEEYFNECSSKGADLWSAWAAPFITPRTWGEMETYSPDDPNLIHQIQYIVANDDSSIPTGLGCALLTFFLDIDSSTFDGFST